ncbi:MAG TPA: M56 family metallopeptidase [Cellvibrio sp.]|nr:M56 family metallopeptidase [Cellvibrio sp.]
MTTGLNAFIGWLFIASLKSLPLIAILLLAQQGLKKYLTASARHGLWLSIFICLNIPFGWQFSWKVAPQDLIPQQEIAAPATAQKAMPEIIFTSNSDTGPITVTKNGTEAETETNSLFINYSLLGYIWVGVFLCLSITTLRQVQRFNHIKKKAVPANKQQDQLLQIGQSILGLNKKIPLLYSNQIKSPLTLGLLKPAIILPADIEQQLTQSQLQHVLLHELAHIQRHDILWNWLAYWTTLLHWFNPLVWYAGKRMKADMEIACDAKVLAHLSQSDRNDYGLTLINVSQLSSNARVLSHSLGILENHRELKNRLIMIKEFTTMTLKKSLIFTLVFSTFTFAALAQPNAKSNEKASIPAPTSRISMTLAEFARHAEKDLKTQILVGREYAYLTIPVNITDKPLDYGQLLSQLKVNELTAYKSSSYIQIIPVKDARSFAIPTVEKGKNYFDDEYVTDSIKLEKACAGNVLATLRPIVPQYGHLTTMESANTLIISDFYRNVVRVKAIVKTLEDNIPQKINCNTSNVATVGGPTKEKK